MNYFNAWIVWFLHHPFLFSLIVFISIILLLFIYFKARDSEITLNTFLVAPFVAVLCYILMFLFGSTISARIIYRQGIESQGVVVSVKNTLTSINDVPIKRYNVIYLLENNKIMESYFLNMGYMYPIPKSIKYPGLEQEFRLRYLPEHPQYFVVVPDMVLDYCLETVLEKRNKTQDYLRDNPDDAKMQQQVKALDELYEELDCPERWMKSVKRK